MQDVLNFLVFAPIWLFDKITAPLSGPVWLLLLVLALFVAVSAVWYAAMAAMLGYAAFAAAKGYKFYYRAISGRDFRLHLNLYRVALISSALWLVAELGWALANDTEKGWIFMGGRGRPYRIDYADSPRQFIFELALRAFVFFLLWQTFRVWLRSNIADFNATETAKPEAPPSPPRASPTARTDHRAAPPP